MASMSKKSTTNKTAKEPAKKKMGRPKKHIDKAQFEAMCGYQCTLEEICGILGITDVTLNTWCKETYGTTFSEVFAQKRAIGKMSLRRSQFKLAQKNASMAIFLGKNYLGQRDSIQIEDHEALDKLDELLEGIKGIATKEEVTNDATERKAEGIHTKLEP